MSEQADWGHPDQLRDEELDRQNDEDLKDRREQGEG